MGMDIYICIVIGLSHFRAGLSHMLIIVPFTSWWLRRLPAFSAHPSLVESPPSLIFSPNLRGVNRFVWSGEKRFTRDSKRSKKKGKNNKLSGLSFEIILNQKSVWENFSTIAVIHSCLAENYWRKKTLSMQVWTLMMMYWLFRKRRSPQSS